MHLVHNKTFFAFGVPIQAATSTPSAADSAQAGWAAFFASYGQQQQAQQQQTQTADSTTAKAAPVSYTHLTLPTIA